MRRWRAGGTSQSASPVARGTARAAPRSSAFVDIITGEPAWFDTRVAMLWDDEYLYFGFAAEETDVWGTLTERDSKIYEENDLEVFIAGRDAYYEFEINALNTIYEVFWIWKDILKPGSIYHARPEFDPAVQRTMVLDGVGGQVGTALITFEAEVKEHIRPQLLLDSANVDVDIRTRRRAGSQAQSDY